MPTKDSKDTDQELLERFQRTGNNQWLGMLLERYTLLLFGVSMKYLKDEEEAKDAVQQVFLKALTELPKYPVTYFKSWLYAVTRNHCLMKLRQQPHKPLEVDEKLGLPAEDDREAQLQQMLRDRQFTLMEEALMELTEEQRTCVEAFYLEKKTYQQIAETTGFNYMQVKSYIQNGKRNLKILLLRKLGQS